jgi:hypothetical protein
MASRHLDKLVKEFISGSSNPYVKYDQFSDLQDPTFLSFNINFFPDDGFSSPTDSYSSGGLFRPPSESADDSNIINYAFYDSAATYLRRIGAPTRQNALQQFKDLLWRIQEQAPWYFQQVTGLSDLFKIDKNINYRGKDKILTIDCLESIDMRMSLLGDLYRLVAFDFQNWREVLPVNLRTFNMEIHVLEMRKFNTTYGIIADALAKPERAFKGEDRQKILQDAADKKNVYGSSPSLFSGTFSNIGNLASSVNNALGGLFTNLGDNAGDDTNTLDSAFEAVSVQTFKLRDCEFDFFTEGPTYLDTVSVKDSAEAGYRFKIHVGKIEKVGYYTFYDHVISEWTKNVRMTKVDLERGGQPSDPYFEAYPLKSVERGEGTNPFTTYEELRQSIFPDFRSQTESYQQSRRESDVLRKKPLENALSSLIQNATPYLNQAINTGLGNLTGGILGTAPLGNVYGNKSFIQKAAQKLNDFLTPGNQLTFDQKSATVSPETLGKDILTGANPPLVNLDGGKMEGPSPNPQNLPKDYLEGANTQQQNLAKSILEGAQAVSQNLPESILDGAGQNSPLGDSNVYNGSNPPGAPQAPNENVFKDNPPLPNSELGSDTNVFE